MLKQTETNGRKYQRAGSSGKLVKFKTLLSRTYYYLKRTNARRVNTTPSLPQ